MHSSPRRGLYRRLLKRPMDFVLSLIAIVLLLPVLVIVAVLVRVSLGSPVIFKQERPGLNEKIFTLYKFRTMTDKRDDKGELLPDEMRLTRVGRLLRSTSLDELPELFNVLKGDMSIVGPRPLAVVYLAYYSEVEKHRHDARPGLSGLAQIHGRTVASWEERFAYDIKYVGDITFWGDLRVIAQTILKVLKREGIAERGTAGNVDFHTYRAKQNQGAQD